MTANTVTLSPGHQTRLQAIIADVKSCQRAAYFLGVCRFTLDRAAAGLRVQRGTAALLTQKIAERDAEGKNP
jgi:hypothetical protein